MRCICAIFPSELMVACSQDSHVLPPEVEDMFRRVQDSAHYMPDWQMEVSLTAQATSPSRPPSFNTICPAESYAGCSRLLMDD